MIKNYSLIRNHRVMKRIFKDIQDIESDPDLGSQFTISQNETDSLKYNVQIYGADDTIYEGYEINGILQFPENYPWSPPSFQFSDKLWHPNIYTDGKVCISILHSGIDETGYESECERWSPVMTARSVIVSIISLLYNPNPDSPANIDAAKMYLNDKNKYLDTVYKYNSEL